MVGLRAISFFDKETGHDGFSSAGVISEQEAQGLARQHFIIHCSDLVRERFHEGSMHSEERVEEVCETDASRFAHEPEQGAIAVEVPGLAVRGDFEGRFAIAIDEFISRFAGGVFISQFDSDRTDPLYIDDSNGAIREHAINRSAAGDFLQFSHGLHISPNPII